MRGEYDEYRPRVRPRRKPAGSSTGLIIGLSVGGVFVLVAVVALVVYLAVKKPGAPDDAGAPGTPDGGPIVGGIGGVNGVGGLLDLPNTKITKENYELLEDGMPGAEVESILGSAGRVPTSGDFDTIFGTKEEGRYTPQYKARLVWEQAQLQGMVVRIWTNGSWRILVAITLPEHGKVLVAKALHQPDGSMLMMSGTGQRQPAAKDPPPKKEPAPKAPPKSGGAVPSLTADALLAEYAADAAAARRKYQGKRVKVTGKIDSVLVTMLTFRTTGPKLQAQLNGVAAGQIGRYTPGDPITVVGVVKAYFPTSGMVLLDNCSLENEP